MSLDTDIAAIARQEQTLRFDRFDEDDAFRLGALIRDEAARQGLSVAIDIRDAARVLFAATMPGTTPDNADWIRRKSAVVLRTHRSSYGFGRMLEARGQSLGADRNMDPADYAAHGGGFPVHVTGIGVVGCVTASGLPQREDHRLVTFCLCKYLGVDPAEYDLPG
ncbi:MAG: heme-degrading domain-containing protein [Rhodobacteraceae bacterium]|nr:heme-degrading domain-containing protein [Paracoccaceae bacterium]